MSGKFNLQDPREKDHKVYHRECTYIFYERDDMIGFFFDLTVTFHFYIIFSILHNHTFEKLLQIQRLSLCPIYLLIQVYVY